jgi:SAM-dependent methyltransferase
MDVSIAPKDATPELSRAEKLLYRLDKSMKILEIGPSYNPTAPKSQGWNCWTIDHEDQANLRAKYKDAGVDVSVIEPVDFIWRDVPLDAVIPQEHMGTFDACIASHVIEHFPNPVQVLRSLQSILTKDGMLSLAVPDKRFCFDYFKPLSMTGDLLHADFLHTARHTRRTAFNHVAYAAYAEGIAAWGQHDIKKMTLVHSLAEAKKHFDELDESPSAPYVDHHAWHYTPSSFRLVMLELNVLGVLEWMEDVFFPAAGCEFFVTLKRQQMRFPSDSAMEAKRLQLLEDVLHDVHEQCVYFDGLSPIAAGRNVGDADARTVRMAVQMTNIEACQEELLRRLGRHGRDVGKIWEVVRAYKKLLLPFRAARRAVVAVYTKRGAIREYIANRAATAGLVPASPMQPGVSDTAPSAPLAAPSAPLAPFAADAFPAASRAISRRK